MKALDDVRRAGTCGTDIEFFTGERQHLHKGHATLPVRIGHEFSWLASDLVSFCTGAAYDTNGGRATY